ncbi:hypothetical protein G6514_003820, partial [Epicoccum nigrum]
LCWLNTKEIDPGFFAADLDEALRVPDQKGYVGRGLQIVHGNSMRGRPHFLDSLNVWYLDDFNTEDLPINACLHGGYGALCEHGLGQKFWRGPLVVHLKAGNDYDAKKMKDITLTAYRDAIDYLAYFRDTIGSMIERPEDNDRFGKLMMERMIGKVKGVRINCLGDRGGDPAREFVQVDVPRAHPVFVEGDDILDIALNFGKSWVVDRYQGYKDASAEEAQNTSGRNLQLAVSEGMLEHQDWGNIPDSRVRFTTGSLLIVNRDQKDLDVRTVQAACRLVIEQVIPLLAEGDVSTKAAVLNALEPKNLEQFM